VKSCGKNTRIQEGNHVIKYGDPRGKTCDKIRGSKREIILKSRITVQTRRPLPSDMSVTYIKLQVQPVKKLNTILFNMECYNG
jgi:hypothetical protein